MSTSKVILSFLAVFSANSLANNPPTTNSEVLRGLTVTVVNAQEGLVVVPNVRYYTVADGSQIVVYPPSAGGRVYRTYQATYVDLDCRGATWPLANLGTFDVATETVTYTRARVSCGAIVGVPAPPPVASPAPSLTPPSPITTGRVRIFIEAALPGQGLEEMRTMSQAFSLMNLAAGRFLTPEEAVLRMIAALPAAGNETRIGQLTVLARTMNRWQETFQNVLQRPGNVSLTFVSTPQEVAQYIAEDAASEAGEIRVGIFTNYALGQKTNANLEAIAVGDAFLTGTNVSDSSAGIYEAQLLVLNPGNLPKYGLDFDELWHKAARRPARGTTCPADAPPNSSCRNLIWELDDADFADFLGRLNGVPMGIYNRQAYLSRKALEAMFKGANLNPENYFTKDIRGQRGEAYRSSLFSRNGLAQAIRWSASLFPPLNLGDHFAFDQMPRDAEITNLAEVSVFAERVLRDSYSLDPSNTSRYLIGITPKSLKVPPPVVAIDGRLRQRTAPGRPTYGADEAQSIQTRLLTLTPDPVGESEYQSDMRAINPFAIHMNLHAFGPVPTSLQLIVDKFQNRGQSGTHLLPHFEGGVPDLDDDYQWVQFEEDAPVAAPAMPIAPMPIAPMPVAPMPVAPMPVAPMPVAPMPVAPMPVAPMPVAPTPEVWWPSF